MGEEDKRNKEGEWGMGSNKYGEEEKKRVSDEIEIL